MKATKMVLVGMVVMMLAAAVPSFALETANSDAGATITVALAIVNNDALEFGAAIAGATEIGTVIIDPDDADPRDFSGAVTLVDTNTQLTPQPAEFTVVGAASALYGITLPDAEDGIEVTNTRVGHGTEKMVVNAFTTSMGAGELSAAGQQIFKVGATPNVGIAQGQGRYEGNFDVTVAYN
jgi:hypothetical protein